MIRFKNLFNGSLNNAIGAGARPAVKVVYEIPIPDAATGDVDIIVDEKVRVINVLIQKVGAATGAFANTLQVKNTATAITEAFSMNGVADNFIGRPVSIDDAANTVAKGGIIRVTRTKAGGNAQAVVYVTCVVVP